MADKSTITQHLIATKQELKQMKKANKKDPNIPVVRQRVASLQHILDSNEFLTTCL